MDINKIIEEVTGERGKWFLIERSKIVEIVQRAKEGKTNKQFDSDESYKKGFLAGYEKGEKAGFEKRSDELYEQAVVGRFNHYIDKPDHEDWKEEVNETQRRCKA